MYAVVLFESDKTNAVVKYSWMRDGGLCYFPPPNMYQKMMRDLKANASVIESWPLYSVKEMRSFVSFEEAQKFSKHISEFEDTADEREKIKRKANKRKNPVKHMGDQFDLTSKMKKAKVGTTQRTLNVEPEKASSGIFEEHLETVEENQREEENIDKQNEVSSADQEIFLEEGAAQNDASVLLEISSLDNVVKSVVENVMTDGLTKLKKEIFEYVDKKYNDLRKDIGLSAEGSSFEKISDKAELKSFAERLVAEEDFKLHMIQTLRALPIIGRHHTIINGKAATYLNFLFSENFLPLIRWGDRPGVFTPNRVSLVDYPSIAAVFIRAMGTTVDGKTIYPESKEMVDGVKNHFKQLLAAEKLSKSVNNVNEDDD